MIEPAIIGARFLQYLGAMVLLGSALFFVYGLPASGPASAARASWPRGTLIGAAALLSLSSLLAIGFQASLFAGSFADGFRVGPMSDVVAQMDLGKAAVVRAVAATAALVLLLTLSPGRTSWLVTAGCGAIATASLAWMGHGAATEGPLGKIHLVSDTVHVLAAAVWVGALTSFVLLLGNSLPGVEHRIALHTALSRFSGVGSLVVALLVLSGLINSWVLVEPQNIGLLWDSPYGRLLVLKIALFLAMLVLAAVNRFRLTPAFGSAEGPAATKVAVGALRRSVGFETAAALAILVLVAWLGTLVPPTAA